MGTTLTARFETRREAEMVVERLVQEHGIERTDIFVAAAGAENSSGEEINGADRQAAEPSPDERGDAALNDAIEVSIDLDDEDKATKVRDAFAEFGGSGVEEG